MGNTTAGIKKRKNIRPIIFLFGLLVIVIFAVGESWVLYLHRAHSTFDNYYNFRGCVQLLEKTENYGRCKIACGQEIKIVKFQNKWYLDGDLPTCSLFGRCL